MAKRRFKMQESQEQTEALELHPTTTLILKLEDQETKNSTQVQLQLFKKEDQLTLVKEVTQAALQALISLGMVEKEAVELKTEIHTIAYRKQ